MLATRDVRHLIGAVLMAGAPVDAQEPSPAPAAAADEWVQVDGRTHPELIPEHALWEAGFSLLSLDAQEPADQRERFLEGLSRQALYISIEEVRIVVQVAGEVVARIGEQLRPVQEERPGTDGSYRSYYDGIPVIVLAGRDQLADRLKPESFKKLRRWLDKEIAPGMTVGVRRSDLPAGVWP